MAYKSKYFQRKSAQQKQYKSKYLQKKAQNLDIAPVKPTTVNTTAPKDEDERKWFQKGAFEDGYQFGDVFKTILSSGTDVAENLSAGIIGMGEKVVDAAAYLAPIFAQSQFYQNGGAYQPLQTQKVYDEFIEDSKKGAARFIQKDLYNEEEVAKKLVLGTDENSVLGEKSDALLQSGGQLLGTAGLQAVGVPWFLTTGATAFGSQAEAALNEGAGYEEAGASAAISAGAEILTEKLSGGIKFGGKTLDDVLLKPLTDKIASKAWKTIVNLGVDAAGEGLEEIFSGAISNLGTALYKEENVGKLLFSEEAMDEYLESFIGGAVLGGFGSGVRAIQDSKRIHLTEDEKKVVDHEFEKRIADQELTEREKNEVRNKVIQDMVNGYITTDTIEEVLGGETYKTHTDTIAREKAMQEEYDTLYQMKSGDKSDAQIDRQAELKKQLDDIKQNFNRNQLGDEVMSLVNGSRLAESYNERSRRGQAFQADVSKYDAKMQATIQKAIDSGILNNTNRTHEFVDMIAKITADKGVPFDFTNNEKLKNSRFAIDGKTVNGYVTKDGVTLNIDSAKSLNSVVGHEITHVLEGTEMYTALQSVVAEYAKTKGEYQSRYDALTKLYEGIEGADVDAELTADLVGDYLFSDTDFVKHLSVTNRNVFQKIFDEIKYLYKVATAGSKEARELEKVKKLFEQAYREGGKAQSDTKYSVSYTKNNRPVAVIENDIFGGKFEELTDGERLKIVKNAIKEFRPGIPVSGRLIGVSRKSAGHFTNSDYTDKIRNHDQRLYEEKLNIAQNIDDVVYATTDYVNEDLKHPREDNIKEFARGTVLLDIGGNKYEADVLVGYTTMREMILYDVQDLRPTQFEMKEKKTQPKLAGNESYTRKTVVSSLEDTVPQVAEDVKHSLSERLTPQQAQMLNIMASNIAREARNNGISLNQYYASTSTIDAFNPTREDAETIATALEPIVKSLGNTNFNGYLDKIRSYATADKDIRFSLSAETDNAYLDAVNRGDTETAQRIFDEVAQKAMPGSKIRTEDGRLRTVYHGTNTGDFTVFNPDYIGMSSGDDGFFGMGFYFAYTKGEASYYGAKRVIPAYLDLRNPFNFDRELQTYNGKQARSGHAPDAVALMNFANKFPEIAKDVTVGVVKNGNDTVEDIPLAEFAKSFSDVIENKKFDYQELTNEYGEKETLVVADEKTVEYEYGGEKHSYRDYGFQKRFWGEANELDVAYEYLANAVYEYVDIPTRTQLILDNNREFTAALKAMGYDGAIQSEYGDEAVAFYPSQIKSAEPVTYDDDGEAIPLSKRFDRKNDDIRHSLSDVGDTPDNHGLAPLSKFKYSQTYGKDIRLETAENAAPVQESTVAENTTVAEDLFPDDLAPVEQELDRLVQEQEALEAQLQEMVEGNDFSSEEWDNTNARWQEVVDRIAELETEAAEADAARVNSLDDADAPPETVAPYYEETERAGLAKKPLTQLTKTLSDELGLKRGEREALAELIQDYSKGKYSTRDELYSAVQRDFSVEHYQEKNELIAEMKQHIRSVRISVSDSVRADIGRQYDGYGNFVRSNFGKIRFSASGMGVDSVYHELQEMYPGYFPADIINPADQLRQIAKVADTPTYDTRAERLPDNVLQDVTDYIFDSVAEYQEAERLDASTESFDALVRYGRVPPAKGDIGPVLKPATDSTIDEAPVFEGRDGQTQMFEPMEEKRTPAEQRKHKKAEHRSLVEGLLGDTSTWKDKRLGISYKVNTLRRNLRDIVRDVNGNPDHARADAIYEELQGKYDHHEAELNKRATEIKSVFAEMKINKYENEYIQMLGELRHNPHTRLTADRVNGFLKAHEKKIDTAKVDRAISEARKMYDSLFEEVNAVLREQGMAEIPYRKGYFPHLQEDKQGFFGKLFNWKVKKDDIPTSIAGLTEEFNPQRSWQPFNKQRKGDKTDYNFLMGVDRYVQGALDWIYHIDDIQKRRAFEEYIRYTHSEKGVQEKVDEINRITGINEEQRQTLIDETYAEAANPLNNFITDFRTQTNLLAGKKHSADRNMESNANREVYSIVSNVSSRVNANIVAGSISSALSNFIPLTQLVARVPPQHIIRSAGEAVRNIVHDDGMVEKSDFLTNRLNKVKNLYRTGWDKTIDVIGFPMEGVDYFTSQTVWRSRYHQNLAKGMSENAAIQEADDFAEGLMAGRSRGSMPTIFEAKNPLTRIFTAFQLEVANQYGYMRQDMSHDAKATTKSKGGAAAKLAAQYTTMFLASYAYNALTSQLTGRYSAFDPIRIVQELLDDLGVGDDDEEEVDYAQAGINLLDNILEETPFVGGLFGGGRIPISSMLPYGEGPYEMVTNLMKDAQAGEWETIAKEMFNPLYYVAMPAGGGQLRKTIQGLSMFSDKHPISGSYTDSGNLRFPVEDNLKNRVQAGLFGQWASKNARDYFDNNRAPLKEKQIQEFIDLDIPISDYWEYREGLSGLRKLEEKADYIAGLDLPIDKKNLLINNLADREEDIDLTGYEGFDGFEEFDFAVNNPEQYEIAQKVGGYEAYMKYQEGMKGMKLAEKADYIAGLDLTTEQKNALINGETERKEPIDLTGYENYSSLEELDFATKYPENYAVAKAVGGYEAYKGYSDELNDIKSDKDKYGKSISGSRKEKVMNYINNLDADYYTKIILWKSEYPSDDTYNYEIIDYLNGREDISFDEMVAILRKLGFDVTDNGDISW